MTDKNPALIEATDIQHHFGTKHVLDNISFKIHSNEIITLIGPNGAGKSTLLKILLKLLTPTSGRVQHRANLRIGFMPQKIHVEPTLPMTVKRFLQLGSHTKKNTTDTLNQVASELEINDLLSQAIQGVSGGEMQRILLARSLMNDPHLLVLDEPVQGVDIQGQKQLYHYINQIKQKHQCGILMVSHDLHIVMKSTDQVLCLNQHLCCSGTPQSINDHPAYLALLGEDADEMAIYEHNHDRTECEHHHGEQA